MSSNSCCGVCIRMYPSMHIYIYTFIYYLHIECGEPSNKRYLFSLPQCQIIVGENLQDLHLVSSQLFQLAIGQCVKSHGVETATSRIVGNGWSEQLESWNPIVSLAFGWFPGLHYYFVLGIVIVDELRTHQIIFLDFSTCIRLGNPYDLAVGNDDQCDYHYLVIN